MKNIFVPYELAVIAKEKEFNEPCLAYFKLNIEKKINMFIVVQDEGMLINNSSFVTNTDEDFNGIAAPLYQQLVDHLRTKHNIRIFESEKSYINVVFFVKAPGKRRFMIMEVNYYAALTKAIEEAFKLI